MAKLSQAERDEGFRAWLAMSDYLLDCEFLAGDVPDMPADPFTEAGLITAENNAIDRYANSAEAMNDQNREMSDKFMRFIGEVFVHQLGGTWTNKPLHDDGSAYIGIKFPWRDETLTIPTLYTSALARRTGQQWAKVLTNLRRARDAERTP
jgi:hypothetical protein